MISGERTVKQSYYDLDLRQYTKRFVREFIETYRSLPALWKVRSKEYTDRAEKKQAYEKLALKLKEVDPNADRDTVKRKINSMRTTFRKEWRKVQSSRRLGGLGESVYKPTLWYYDLLLFLHEQDSHIPFTVPDKGSPIAIGSVCKQEPPDYEEYDEDFLEEDSQEFYNDIQSGNECRQEADIFRERWPPAHKSTPPVQTLMPPVPLAAAQTLSTQAEACEEATTKQSTAIPDDEFDCIARTWAIKLKRMSPMQKLFAERLVNDVLFEGELGMLSRTSVLNVNPKSD